MKHILTAFILLTTTLTVAAQQEFTIEGHVKGMEDGTVVNLLYEEEGGLCEVVARDTARQEQFHFRGNTRTPLDKMGIMVIAEGYPSMDCEIYVTPNARITINGNDKLLYTWDVESDVREQQEHNLFLQSAKPAWKDLQKTVIEMDRLIPILLGNSSTDEERESARKKRNALIKESNDYKLQIEKSDIELLKVRSYSCIEMEKLHDLSWSIRSLRECDEDDMEQYSYKQYPYQDEVIALYNRLTDEQKASPKGQDIAANLFPPVTVGIGDDMADTDFYDLQGQIHHLEELKGKYILLDFWSCGCGPCLAAQPEMKQVSEQFRDRLHIVSISVDPESSWKTASERHEMTWHNWNDKKQQNGIYQRYNGRGYPYFIVISPEGKLIESWIGYGEGLLKKKIETIIE